MGFNDFKRKSEKKRQNCRKREMMGKECDGKVKPNKQKTEKVTF